MTYWTIQHKAVIDQLNKNGTYYPDFSLSPQNHRETYDRLLNLYNSINQTSFKGLVFCIEKDASHAATSLAFDDEQDFVGYLNTRKGVLGALNNGAYKLFDENHLLCRIETDKFDDLCPCRVDFWNFVFMMPDEDGGDKSRYEVCRDINSAYAGLSYEDFLEQAWCAMSRQQTLRPIMSSTVFQSHIPYLDKNMLRQSYPISDLF